jgi:hypothetical protein
MPRQSQAIWFPQWSDSLQQLRLPPIHRQQYRLALIRYLRFCKETRQQVTVNSARGAARCGACGASALPATI